MKHIVVLGNEAEAAKSISSNSVKLAVRQKDACLALAVSRTTLWRLIAKGKIKQTSYGTIPVSEMESHLRREICP